MDMFIFNKIKTFIFLIVVFVCSGCASFKTPLYPDIIYNNRQPLISVTYEYGEIQLILPIKYDGAVPDNILFKVYSQGDTTHPIISILQEAPKEFLAYLPQGVLDIRNNTNLIKIIPQDKNFDPINVRFEGVQFGRIVLPPKTIRIGQLIVSGYTRLNTNDSIISGVDVSIQNFGEDSANTFPVYLLEKIDDFGARLLRPVLLKLEQEKRSMFHIKKSMENVKYILAGYVQRFDILMIRFPNILESYLQKKREKLLQIKTSVLDRDFIEKDIQAKGRLVKDLGKALNRQVTSAYLNKKSILFSHSRLHNSLNYKRTLSRGYAIVRDKDMRLVRDKAHATKEKDLLVEFEDGFVAVKVQDSGLQS